MTDNYQSIEYNGKMLTLTEYPYCDNYGTDGKVRYYAHARDVAGSLHRIAWGTTPEWDATDPLDRTDDHEACDWEMPVAVELVEESALVAECETLLLSRHPSAQYILVRRAVEDAIAGYYDAHGDDAEVPSAELIASFIEENPELHDIGIQE
jgi:hypothetical protein